MELKDHKRAFREQQLVHTLKHAAEHSAFYRSRLGGIIDKVNGLNDLALVPLLTKDDFALHGPAMTTSAEFPRRIGFTSGTSYSGESGADVRLLLLQTQQSQSEFEVWSKFQETLFQTVSGSPSKLSLRLISAMHGGEFMPPAPGTFQVPLSTPFHFEHIKDLLQKSYEYTGYGDRIERLVGSTQHLKLLAALLIRAGIRPADLGLREVHTFGWQLTRQWRGNFEGAFDARVGSIYGISEVPGSGASECTDCGGFHFAPLVVPEVIHPSAPAVPISAGFGELVLTSLAPFAAYQPVIRYRTGDLVEILPRCPVENDLGVRLRGRIARSLISDNGEVLLPSSSVFELLDGVAEINRDPHGAAKPFGLELFYGFPRYELRDFRVDATRAATASLHLELCYHPRFFAADAQRLKEMLLARLKDAAHPDLRVEVCLHQPGGLANVRGVIQ